MREWTLLVDGRPARACIGGAAGREPLLLLHGGWGGAALHWSSIWESLEARFHVIAPELPGLSSGSPPGPRDVPGFAAWVESVLDALGVQGVWVVGNSFGAAVAWHFASTRRARCRGLVLVNGAPPEIPLPARVMFAVPGSGPLVKSIVRRLSFSRHALRRAFADPARAPDEIRHLFDGADTPQLALMADTLRRGGTAPEAPRVPTLILWGLADHLSGDPVASARRLQQRIPGSQLALIEGAGHLPQLEQPAAVVEALIRFMGSRAEP